MNKIICEICGTAFPDTSDCCPICGCSKEYSQEHTEVFPDKMPEYIPEGRKKGGAFSASHRKLQKELYDYDEDDGELPGQSDSSGAPGHGDGINVFIVVILTVLIAVSLLAAGYLFFRYELPARNPEEPLSEPTELIGPTQTETETTEAPTIPCESLVLTATAPTLTKEGQFWLLHTIVTPEDTTDKLIYVSADESVVTVTGEGRLCAVGSGQTEVSITCGSKQIVCPVTVALEAGATQSAEQTRATEETAPETTAQAAPEYSETESTEAQPAKSVELKLKQTDITFSKKGVTHQLELDCDLKPEEVTWFVMNSKVVICHDGLITVLGPGTTRVVARYGDQEVSCIVRVKLK